MNRIWTLVFLVHVLDCIGNYRYFVFGEVNQSCVTHDNSCSICCASSKCHNDGNYLNSCLDGCIDGHRGARCYELCDFTCKTCDSHISYCDSCFDGYFPGPNKDCKSKCLSNCKTCTSDTNCHTCKEGFLNKDGSTDCRYLNCPENCHCNSSTCVMCKDGFYNTSESCMKICPKNCYSCSSNTNCNSCKDGFYSSDDQKTCSNTCHKDCLSCSSYDKCLKCQTGLFGHKCQNNCSIGCTDNVCSIENRKCHCLPNFDGENCSDCVPGYYGSFCDIKCPDNCKNNACGRSQGNCTGGCKSDTMSGNYCENCIVGKYGLYCENNCPKNCLNGKCDKENGTCSEDCKDGFKGLFCLECVQGKYGDECKDDCPDTCKDNNCEKLSGYCIECKGHHFDGMMCDFCKPGFYGSFCEQKCSSGCTKITCNKDSGKCSHGCKDEYSGDNCCINSNNCVYCKNNTACRECKSGYFGQTCNRTCSDLCINNICEFNTGICTEGCRALLDDIICVRKTAKPLDDNQSDSNGSLKTVLGTLLAVTSVSLCVLISKMILEKFVAAKRRKKEESTTLIGIESVTVEMHNSSNGDENKGDESAYETLDVRSLGNNKYGSANVQTSEDKASDEKEQYVNMMI